jgi:hypothetical protein
MVFDEKYNNFQNCCYGFDLQTLWNSFSKVHLQPEKFPIARVKMRTIADPKTI